MTSPLPPPRWVLWGVASRHLDEADFLFEAFEGALSSHREDLASVEAGVEERLLASVEGLAAGGPKVREKLLLPALEEDSASLVAAGATALLASGDVEAVVRVLERGDDVQRKGARRALELGHAPEELAPLHEMARRGAPEARAAALRVLAYRGDDIADAAYDVAATDAPELVMAALFAGRAPGGEVTKDLAFTCLSAEDPRIRDLALVAATLHGLPDAWPRAVAVAAAHGPAPRWPFLLVALGGGARDHAELGLLTSSLASPEARADALWALGFSGRAAAAEACLPLLGDAGAGGLAAEAFTAITGLAGEGFTLPAPRPSPDAPLDASPEAALPRLDPAAANRWWSENRARFEPRRRYLGGALLDPALVRRALARGPMRRRAALALDLALGSGARAPLETTARTARQRAELSALSPGGVLE